MFEFNPFELDVNVGTDPIKSITVSSNIDWFNVPAEPITGENAVLPIEVRSDITAYKVFATGASTGAPSMRALTAPHIPNIEISQVNGLQAAINSIVKTLSGGSPFLTVTPNGSGDYQLTVNTGTTSSTVAIGNDTRFPASVTGLRKSSGAGSTDVAAVAKTDYWDTTVFVASGGSHAKGLVPDPGASAGTTKFLREDATWVVPAGSGTVTNIATTSPISGGPITTTGTISLLVNVDFAWTAAQSIKLSNATTNAVDPLFTIGHNSSGTAANGFGGRLRYQLEDSTTNDQDAAFIDAAWSDATHASHAAYIDFLVSTGGGAPASKMRLWGSGGLSVNNTTDPTAGIVSCAKFKTSGVLSSLLKTDGAGLETAAVAKTDYWDTTDFIGIGPSNAKGLVPAPGNPGGAPSRYLRDDATWQVFTPANASLTNAMLATMAAKTLKANATGSTASPTDVDAKTARSSALLNFESITMHGDSDYTILSTDRYVSTSATLTAARTWTLPLANSFNPGQPLTISDDFGGINGANGLLVIRQGADTIQGSSAAITIASKYGSLVLVSDGSSKWSLQKKVPSVSQRTFSSNTTYNTPVGVKLIIVECLGAGGGGAGAQASASNASAGQGGGAGAYAYSVIASPAATYSITIGAGGAGGVGLAAGGNGGATVFGSSVVSADGGQGGGTMTSGTSQLFNNSAGLGGTSVIGDFAVAGSDSSFAIRLSGTVAASGDGAQAPVYGSVRKGRTTEGNGLTSTSLGSGGSGALSLTTGSFNGGAGSQGYIIVTEYY